MKPNFIFVHMWRNLIILTVAILFQACVHKRDLSENTVVVQIPVNIAGLHITNDLSAYRALVFEYIHKPMMRTDLRINKVIPVLSDSFPQMDETGTRFLYTIKKGVKWDNGEVFDADDVIFTVKVILAPLTNNPQLKGNFLGVIKSVEKVNGRPDQFVLVTQSRNRGALEILTEVYFMQESIWDPKHLLHSLHFEDCFNPNYQSTPELSAWFEAFNAPERSREPKWINGLGPYAVTEWVDDNYILIEKKKNWWGDADTNILLANEPDKIMFRVIKDENAVYYALRNENIDAINRVGMSKFQKLRKHKYFNETYHSAFIDQYAYNYFGMNTKPDGVQHKPFFTDKRVRKAMAYLIPVDNIIKVLYRGNAARQVSFISPFKREYNTDLQPIEFSLAKAEALLDEAGWKDTDKDGIRDKTINGEKVPFRFHFNYMSGAYPSKEIGLMIHEEMWKAGIDAIPSPQEFSLFYQKLYSHDFDAALGAWMGSAAYEDPTQLWHTSQWAMFGSNFCGFGNAASDSLISSINEEMNDSLYLVKIKELQRMVVEEQPYVFLFSPKARVAIHRRFKGDMYVEKPQYYLNAFQLISASSASQPVLTP